MRYDKSPFAAGLKRDGYEGEGPVTTMQAKRKGPALLSVVSEMT